MNKTKAVICDLDGTLTDNSHRLHFINNHPKDWNSYNDAMVGDAVNTWCRDILWGLSRDGYTILFVTGRSEVSRLETENWLARKECPHGFLFMRKDKDYRDDFVIKGEIYTSLIAPKYDVKFCLEDRRQVVDMWRMKGLVCLHCANGEF